MAVPLIDPEEEHPMSMRTVHFCDRCGKECPYDSIYATVDRRADAAGGMEDVVESVDLCPPCMRAVMEDVVRKMSHEQAAAWVKDYRKKLEVKRV